MHVPTAKVSPSITSGNLKPIPRDIQNGGRRMRRSLHPAEGVRAMTLSSSYRKSKAKEEMRYRKAIKAFIINSGAITNYTTHGMQKSRQQWLDHLTRKCTSTMERESNKQHIKSSCHLQSLLLAVIVLTPHKLYWWLSKSKGVVGTQKGNTPHVQPVILENSITYWFLGYSIKTAEDKSYNK